MEDLETGLKVLRLPTFLSLWRPLAKQAEEQGAGYVDYLKELVEAELEERRKRRIQRLLRSSQLPPGKTFENFNEARFRQKVRAQVRALLDGSFLSEAINVLVFGNPGTGKTHLVSAIGHELVRKGFSVLFTPTYSVVQRLLAAKREFALRRELGRLDRFECLILDDLGYIQQDKDEMEVLFTLFSHRYERRSVVITSNLVFSQWERIFKDPMTTAAAIDRLVHHSVIIELQVPSYRKEEARRGKAK